MLWVGLVVFGLVAQNIIALNRTKVKQKVQKKEDEMEKFYDCKQVAERYGVKITTVWDWIKTGKLKAVRIGRFYRIKEEALAEFEKSK